MWFLSILFLMLADTYSSRQGHRPPHHVNELLCSHSKVTSWTQTHHPPELGIGDRSQIACWSLTGSNEARCESQLSGGPLKRKLSIPFKVCKAACKCRCTTQLGYSKLFDLAPKGFALLSNPRIFDWISLSKLHWFSKSQKHNLQKWLFLIFS